MNDVRTLFEGLVADAPPDQIDLDRVVARGTHRRKVRRIVTSGAGVAAALVVGSGIAYVVMPDDTRTAPPVTDLTPREPTPGAYAEVSCTPQGIEVTPTTISAQPFGVLLDVTSTGLTDSYLGYESASGSGESGSLRLRNRELSWTLSIAPGDFTLFCAPRGGGEPSERVTLTVKDPRGYWRGDTIPGCQTGGATSWRTGLNGEGDTPAEAVEETLDGFRADNDGRPAAEVVAYTARPAETGYTEGYAQSWLVSKDGEPYATISVVSHADLRFTSRPDFLCG